MPRDESTAVQVTRNNALTVDVEEHFMVEAFADRITPEMWPQFPSRVVDNTHRILEMFARHGARATFFIVGWVAERHPALMRDIVAAGHEIGCHSYMHRAIWKMSPEEFRQDLRQSIAVIEDAVGNRVQGFRAPTFSIVPRTLWALEILAEAGLRYDSSVFPVRHDLYGMPEAPRSIFRWQLTAGELYELPMTTLQLFGRNLPAAGGGYLRLLPLWYNRRALRKSADEGRPGIVYLHPWELDPAQPRMQGQWLSRLRHYRNLDKTERRLDALLSEFRFAPMYEVLEAEIRRSEMVGKPLLARAAAV